MAWTTVPLATPLIRYVCCPMPASLWVESAINVSYQERNKAKIIHPVPSCKHKSAKPEEPQ